VDTASIKIRKTAIGREKHSKMTSVAPWSNQTLLVEPDHYLVEPDPVLYPTLADGVSSLPQRRRLQPPTPPSPDNHAAVSCRPHRRLFPTVGVPWMHEDGFAGEIEAAPPEHRFTVQGSESVMGS